MKKPLVLVIVLLSSMSPTSAADEKPAKKKEADNPQIDRLVQSMLDRFDTNKDGKISKAEAKGKLAENFDKLDLNKDGFLDRDELRPAARVMAANMAKGDNAKPGANASTNAQSKRDRRNPLMLVIYASSFLRSDGITHRSEAPRSL